MTAKHMISPKHAYLRRLTWALALTPLLGACGTSAPSSPGTPDTPETQLPLIITGTHVGIAARINDQPVTLLLDSGSDQNVIAAATVARLGLVPSTDTVPGQGAGGGYGQVPWVNIDRVTLGPVQQRDQLAFVVPLPPEFTADGVLGTPFFKAFIVTIDYEHGMLTLRSRKNFTPPANATPLTIHLDFGKLIVNATAAGVTGWYVIDTGASNALTFFTPTVEHNNLRGALQPSIRTVTGIGAGGRTVGDLARVPEFMLGPFRFTQMIGEMSLAQQGVFSSARYAGNLGGELWRRFTVTFDYAGETMYLEPNDAYAQSFVPPRSGLVAMFETAGLRVVDVVAGSPAAEAGVAIGDIIVTLDGFDASQVSPYALRAALNQAPATPVRLRLRDSAGHERDVSLILRDLL